MELTRKQEEGLKIVLDKYKKNAKKYEIEKAKGNSTKYNKL